MIPKFPFLLSMYLILFLSGLARRQPYCGYVAPSISTSISIYFFNVFAYDMYKKWNWEINILYISSNDQVGLPEEHGRYFKKTFKLLHVDCTQFILTPTVHRIC